VRNRAGYWEGGMAAQLEAAWRRWLEGWVASDNMPPSIL